MATDELTCRELVEIVTDYVEGALPLPERARFEAHLRECPGCTTYVEQMRETVRLTGGLREEHLPPDARDTLLAAFREWKRA
ncbi:MAG TPA: zf-HC2 domain-containing protein [Gaiellaceae bacterium]|nr:zf-HC2 domain-containing protein [Gaiellaceae bacterium]